MSAKRDVRREQAVSDSVHPLKDQQPTPHDQVVKQENGLRLRRALSRLSADHRRVILLRNWEQMPFGRVAEELGRSEEAARKLWSRAMRQLQQQLSNEIQQESR